MATSEDTEFPRLVSLACHDLRTPLATISGFARTLTRLENVDEPIAGYLQMIDAACEQLAEVLEVLSLLARLESGRYEPALRPVDSRRLADAAGAADGAGGSVLAEPDDAARALRGLAEAARRHGGLPSVEVLAEGRVVSVEPVVAEAAAIVTGEDPKDLAAAVGRRALEAQGAEVELRGERLLVTFPAAP